MGKVDGIRARLARKDAARANFAKQQKLDRERSRTHDLPSLEYALASDELTIAHYELISNSEKDLMALLAELDRATKVVEAARKAAEAVGAGHDEQSSALSALACETLEYDRE